MMRQSETLSSTQIVFITLFSAGAQRCCAFYQPPKTVQLYWAKTIFLSQTGICWPCFHPIVPCRITYWAPLEMFLARLCNPLLTSGFFNPCIQVYVKLGFDEVVVFQLVKLLLRRAFVAAGFFNGFAHAQFLLLCSFLPCMDAERMSRCGNILSCKWRETEGEREQVSTQEGRGDEYCAEGYDPCHRSEHRHLQFAGRCGGGARTRCGVPYAWNHAGRVCVSCFLTIFYSPMPSMQPMSNSSKFCTGWQKLWLRFVPPVERPYKFLLQKASFILGSRLYLKH